MPKILVVTANGNTQDTHLQLGVEERNIRGALGRTSNFTVVHESEARSADLIDQLVVAKPDILHFAGHGSGGDDEEPAIRLVGDDGRPQIVTKESLATIFTSLQHKPRLVLLNSCFSADQAVTLVENLDVVVGVKGKINDTVARSFAARFYRILGESYSVQASFDLAKAAVDPSGYISEQLSIQSGVGIDPRGIVFLGRPELLAKFLCDKNGKPTYKNEHYDIELWLRGVDQHVDTVTYQICHETFEAKGQNFWQVSRSEHKNFLEDQFRTMGDVTLRVTTWSKGDGIGFETTIGEALRRHYGRSSKQHIAKAIEDLESK